MTARQQNAVPCAPRTCTRAIESDSFPIGFVSKLALRESWRKELHRPVYYTHKWWARRLGSVFRAILVGCVVPPGADFAGAFYRPGAHPGVSVLDPFMGSGTTVGEAHKMGFTSFGADINPVACEAVRVSMSALSRDGVREAFDGVEREVAGPIRSLYEGRDSGGRRCDVLYFFWVKRAECPLCGSGVDLFSTYAFARNASPARAKNAHVVCPGCGDVFAWVRGGRGAECPSCARSFCPEEGPARGPSAECGACRKTFSIADSVRAGGGPPAHRLYCKLVLRRDGGKEYVRATSRDEDDYARCSAALRSAVEKGEVRLPATRLSDGRNTRQAIRYNYLAWRDFFNDRQLLALGRLQSAIWRVAEPACRDALMLLFSGALEFNNMFASYKGEGTGAVRHMFSHHVLRPERMPLEANVWGTEKSSGSFSGLFRSRLLRALDYRSGPFELAGGGRVPSGGAPAWNAGAGFRRPEPGGIRLACASSDRLDLADGSVDYVVTDPPFFDNVNYSELADFFHSWQRLYPRGFVGGGKTTRARKEVQDSDPGRFAEKLAAVFSECRRVLSDDGLLVFTYHHSRPEGWTSVSRSLHSSGFEPVNAHPVKSEMSVSVPMAQSASPIQLDVIFVCRKGAGAPARPGAAGAALEAAGRKARALWGAGLDLSRADARTVLYSQFVVASGRPVSEAGLSGLDSLARASGLFERAGR